MRPIVFRRARTVDEALKLGREFGEAVYLAGGTTLLDLMKQGVENPSAVIDVNRIPGLADIAESGGALTIGSLVRNSDLASDARVGRGWPLLSAALLAGASAQLRNMATVGGNLLQRTRCVYFRDPTFPCNKRVPTSGCPALDGYNRNHAILGVSEHCIAMHPSDMLVAMVAYGGTVQVVGSEGPRAIDLEDFHRLPGDTPHLENVLRQGEFITGVRLAAPPARARSSYVKVRDRASYEFALTSAGALLVVDEGRIAWARVGLGGVATKPWRARSAEHALLGQAPGPSVFEVAARAAFDGAAPRAANGFKVELGQRALVRALEQAMEQQS